VPAIGVGDVASLIREEFGPTIIGFTTNGSSALAAARASNRLINMGTRERSMPVQTALLTAGWVGESATDPTGVKPTSKLVWGNRQLVVEEIAVIVPVHENVLRDATEDLLTDVSRNAGMALGVKVDRAVFFGTEKPVTWTSPALLPAAVAAGNTVEVAPGTSTDLYGAFLESFALLDLDGHDPGRLFAPKGLRWRMANLRDGENRPLLSNTGNGTEAFDGVDATWVAAADGTGPTWDRSAAEAIVLDPARFVMGLRQDITVKFLDQATITIDPTTVPPTLLNLAERDHVALRFVMRVAYVLATGLTTEGTITNPVAAVLPFTP
jgi:HK97 family phage major capsid protein